MSFKGKRLVFAKKRKKKRKKKVKQADIQPPNVDMERRTEEKKRPELPNPVPFRDQVRVVSREETETNREIYSYIYKFCVKNGRFNDDSRMGEIKRCMKGFEKNLHNDLTIVDMFRAFKDRRLGNGLRIDEIPVEDRKTEEEVSDGRMVDSSDEDQLSKVLPREKMEKIIESLTPSLRTNTPSVSEFNEEKAEKMKDDTSDSEYPTSSDEDKKKKEPIEKETEVKASATVDVIRETVQVNAKDSGSDWTESDEEETERVVQVDMPKIHGRNISLESQSSDEAWSSSDEDIDEKLKPYVEMKKSPLHRTESSHSSSEEEDLKDSEISDGYGVLKRELDELVSSDDDDDDEEEEDDDDEEKMDESDEKEWDGKDVDVKNFEMDHNRKRKREDDVFLDEEEFPQEKVKEPTKKKRKITMNENKEFVKKPFKRVDEMDFDIEFDELEDNKFRVITGYKRFQDKAELDFRDRKGKNYRKEKTKKKKGAYKGGSIDIRGSNSFKFPKKKKKKKKRS